MTKAEYAAYQEAVAEFFEREGVRNLSTGHLRCPDCSVEFEAGCCPQCEKDAGHFPVEPYFSWLPCGCCGCHLGGDRFDASGYNPTTKEVQEYRGICTDCVYYAEYGRLDDQTMAELEP